MYLCMLFPTTPQANKIFNICTNEPLSFYIDNQRVRGQEMQLFDNEHNFLQWARLRTLCLDLIWPHISNSLIFTWSCLMPETKGCTKKEWRCSY